MKRGYETSRYTFLPWYETCRSMYETTRLWNVLHPSRLLRFSADLTMYWLPVCHFRCMKFKPLVIWIWNQNIAISTIVGTSSHINLFITSARPLKSICSLFWLYIWDHYVYIHVYNPCTFYDSFQVMKFISK